MREMKTMRLYDRVERVEAELRARGLDDGHPLSVDELAGLDHLHYHGTAAVDAAIDALGVDASSRVLDIGSGLGGPARWIAARTGAHVTALELQHDLDALAARLTARCGLAGRVEHVCGDVLAGAPGGPYDAALSILAFLHIADRPRLLGACRDALVPGGRLAIEDFTLRRAPDPDEAEDLRVKVRTPYCPDLPTYRRELAAAGLEVLDVADMTASWTAFTAERLAAFRADRDRVEALHGEDVYLGLEDFYATVAGLYAGGVLGGARILASRAA